MLHVDGIRTGYGKATVIRDVSLTVGSGEIIALVGANGAGKSTLARALSGLIPLTAGSIFYDGKSIDRLLPRQRVTAGIVHVPEGRHVFGGLSVRDNLRLGGYAIARTNRATAGLAPIDRAVRLFPDLGSRLDVPAGNLSGGQQQMLAIARGLMASPRLLVLDEPSLGLAPLLVEQIFGMIVTLRDQGLSILLSEQNARMALSIADRGYVIELGRIVEEGVGSVLLNDEAIARRYLGGAAGGGPSGDDVRETTRRLREALAPGRK